VALEIRGKARFVLMPCCKREGLRTLKNPHSGMLFFGVITKGYIVIPEIHMTGIKMAMTWLLSDVSSTDSGEGGATP
jgi:hypothetical protein